MAHQPHQHHPAHACGHLIWQLTKAAASGYFRQTATQIGANTARNQWAQPTTQPQPTRGDDVESEAELCFCQAAVATEVPVQTIRERGRISTIWVPLPAHVQDGEEIGFQGKGSLGANGGPAGDLYVTFKVRASDVFAGHGDDMTVLMPVTFSEVRDGAYLRVPVLRAHPVTIRIPSGTRTDKKLRITGHGFRRPDNSRGNLLVTLELVSDSIDVHRLRADLIAQAAQD